jgi:hypothetical protein
VDSNKRRAALLNVLSRQRGSRNLAVRPLAETVSGKAADRVVDRSQWEATVDDITEESTE